MKKIEGRRNISIQLDERIIERIEAAKGKHCTLAWFIRSAVMRQILELEGVDPGTAKGWLGWWTRDGNESSFFAPTGKVTRG